MLQKMAAEIAKAVDPAGNYGTVADHLKAASKQMQAKNNSAASQSLGEAAKELEKLAQQMSDAQSLEAELEALNQGLSHGGHRPRVARQPRQPPRHGPRRPDGQWGRHLG